MEITNIHRNIYSRQLAQETIDFAVKQCVDLNKGNALFNELRYWEVMFELIAERLPKPEQDNDKIPMSEAEARIFENETMPFGKHQGETISELPTEYLINFSEGKINKKILRYVQSTRFKSHVRRSEYGQ